MAGYSLFLCFVRSLSSERSLNNKTANRSGYWKGKNGIWQILKFISIRSLQREPCKNINRSSIHNTALVYAPSLFSLTISVLFLSFLELWGWRPAFCSIKNKTTILKNCINNRYLNTSESRYFLFRFVGVGFHGVVVDGFYVVSRVWVGFFFFTFLVLVSVSIVPKETLFPFSESSLKRIH